MADVQRELEQLAAVGYCVVPDVIPPDRIAALREHVVRGREAAQREYAAIGGDLTSQRTADGGPGKKVVAYVPEFAAHLADERILARAARSTGESVSLRSSSSSGPLPTTTRRGVRGIPTGRTTSRTTNGLASSGSPSLTSPWR